LIWSSLARLSQKTQDYDKALVAISKVIEAKPHDLEARLRRAELYRLQGAGHKAFAETSEVIRLDPNNAAAYSTRAILHNSRDDFKSAISDSDRSIQINPRDLDAYLQRGYAYLRLSDYDQAIKDLTEGIKLTPTDEIAWLNRGSAFAKQRKYKEALDDFLQASNVNPRSAYAFNSVAWLLATCPDSTFRDGSKATEYITQALQLEPDRWSIWDTRAAAFAENGDFENAVAWEERCLERKDLSEDERKNVTERVALYRTRKPYREEPK
jgi:tetratricopeptide (TPR) repeat protein